jgi:hypothetical protein
MKHFCHILSVVGFCCVLWGIPTPAVGLVVTTQKDANDASDTAFIVRYSIGRYLTVFKDQDVEIVDTMTECNLEHGEPVVVVTHGRSGKTGGFATAFWADKLGLCENITDVVLAACSSGSVGGGIQKSVTRALQEALQPKFAKVTVTGMDGCAVTTRDFTEGELNSEIVEKDVDALNAIQKKLIDELKPQEQITAFKKQHPQATLAEISADAYGDTKGNIYKFFNQFLMYKDKFYKYGEKIIQCPKTDNLPCQ